LHLLQLWFYTSTVLVKLSARQGGRANRALEFADRA